VAEVAVARGISRAQVALAWLLSKPVVTAPIVGATKLSQLDEAMASVQVKLSDEEIASLEAPYVPHAWSDLPDRSRRVQADGTGAATSTLVFVTGRQPADQPAEKNGLAVRPRSSLWGSRREDRAGGRRVTP
jgi:Aldo/keto reductase family